jgi:hypothetical protein
MVTVSYIYMYIYIYNPLPPLKDKEMLRMVTVSILSLKILKVHF